MCRFTALVPRIAYAGGAPWVPVPAIVPVHHGGHQPFRQARTGEGEQVGSAVVAVPADIEHEHTAAVCPYWTIALRTVKDALAAAIYKQVEAISPEQRVGGNGKLCAAAGGAGRPHQPCSFHQVEQHDAVPEQCEGAASTEGEFPFRPAPEQVLPWEK